MPDNFGNFVYTALLDPTDLTTAGGRAFLEKLGGKAAGDEIVDGYIQVLAAVPGYPYAITTTPAGAAGTESAPLGLRVDDQQLLDMNAYLQGLAAPAGVLADAGSRMRGKAMFRTTCTSATTWDQGRLCLTSSSP